MYLIDLTYMVIREFPEHFSQIHLVEEHSPHKQMLRRVLKLDTVFSFVSAHRYQVWSEQSSKTQEKLDSI